MESLFNAPRKHHALMNLHSLLNKRAGTNTPVRIGLIGAGKFGTMFLSQAVKTPGFHIYGIADLDPDKVRRNMSDVGWAEEQFGATSFDDASRNTSTFITDDAAALIKAPGMDVIIEATGNPVAGIAHTLAAFDQGCHVVAVNVEADVLAGPLLAARAKSAGVVYSLAYGDQPALIAEMVDWARTCGLNVVCAGKGTKYLPEYHGSTPDTVWDYYGLTAERARLAGMNPQMFNSFLDGTKSSIEMAAVANACGLTPPEDGLLFPAVGTDKLAEILKPACDGGILGTKGTVEVISSLNRDGSDVTNDLRWGVYCVFEAGSSYVERCFADYGLVTDKSGRYSAMYKPFHLIGLELGISVASAALRKEPTGCPEGWHGDVVAVAKKDLNTGDVLDGEGGFCVWGKLLSAQKSRSQGGLPIGLAHHVTLKRPVKQGTALTWGDVDMDESQPAVVFRREMEKTFLPTYK